MPKLEHIPTRPGFDCSLCEEPWPCAPAKVQLAEEYIGARPALMMYLSLQLYDALTEAIHDHDWKQVDDLYDRFIAWARQSPGAGRGNLA